MNYQYKGSDTEIAPSRDFKVGEMCLGNTKEFKGKPVLFTLWATANGNMWRDCNGNLYRLNEVFNPQPLPEGD